MMAIFFGGLTMAFNLDWFLGNMTATPTKGSVPLEVKFTPGNPYSRIREVSENYDYKIVETNDSDYKIVEEQL